VLPYMHRNPAHGVKLHVFLAITFHVAREFSLPPLAVIFRQNAMVRARVPETPIDEHGNARPGERDIRTAGQPRVIHPVPQTAPVQFPPDHYLRPSRSARHPLHLSRNHSIKWRWTVPCIHHANSFRAFVGRNRRRCASVTHVILRPQRQCGEGFLIDEPTGQGGADGGRVTSHPGSSCSDRRSGYRARCAAVCHRDIPSRGHTRRGCRRSGG
jgi:hypothetical protein